MSSENIHELDKAKFVVMTVNAILKAVGRFYRANTKTEAANCIMELMDPRAPCMTEEIKAALDHPSAYRDLLNMPMGVIIDGQTLHMFDPVFHDVCC